MGDGERGRGERGEGRGEGEGAEGREEREWLGYPPAPVSFCKSRKKFRDRNEIYMIGCLSRLDKQLMHK